jgi:hypothetical protein
MGIIDAIYAVSDDVYSGVITSCTLTRHLCKQIMDHGPGS